MQGVEAAPGKEPLTRGAGGVLAVFALCALPFLTKAFEVDDPLFLWTAEHLRAHPLDFYGFSVNWYGSTVPMSEITKNPPLASYFLMLSSLVVGTSEPGLHLAFLVPALGVVLGTFVLARDLCDSPREAALLAALTPVFLVSTSTVMCDVLTLCSWIWAVVLWRRGLVERRHLWLGLAMVFASLAPLTKYLGVAVLPLLFAYALLRERRLGVWALWFLVPAAALTGYQQLTRALYGNGLLLDAASYATHETTKVGLGLASKALIGLSFTGGSFLSLLFFGPRLRSRRALVLGLTLGLAIAAGAVLLWQGALGSTQLRTAQGVRWTLVLQLVLFLWGGLVLLALCVQDLVEARDADAALLALWIGGIFAFAAFFNWTVNARSLLPMTPAVGILVLRRVRVPVPALRTAWPLLASGAVALLVAQADASQANCAREAARRLSPKPGDPGPTWFQGHWGFQYYAQRQGLSAVDFKTTTVRAGERVILPRTNSNVRTPRDGTYTVEEVLELPQLPWASTMDRAIGAGFHTDKMGILPFGVGQTTPETYAVIRLTVPLGPSRTVEPAPASNP